MRSALRRFDHREWGATGPEMRFTLVQPQGRRGATILPLRPRLPRTQLVGARSDEARASRAYKEPGWSRDRTTTQSIVIMMVLGFERGMEAHWGNNNAPWHVQRTTTDQPCRHRSRNAVNTRHHRHMHPPRRTVE